MLNVENIGREFGKYLYIEKIKLATDIYSTGNLKPI